MAEYLILNLAVVAAVCLIIGGPLKRPGKPWLVTLAGLTILTAVFDNIIIWLDIVEYESSKILNILVGIAPIEDFFYAILAVILIPAVWHKLGSRHAH